MSSLLFANDLPPALNGPNLNSVMADIRKALAGGARVYNPKWETFGATGDGSGTGDWDGIMGAIAEAGAQPYGGIVSIPGGDYKVTQEIAVEYDNVLVVGDTRGYPFTGTPTTPPRGGTVIRMGTGFSGSQVIRVGQPSGTADRCLAGSEVACLTIMGSDIGTGVHGLFLQTLDSVVKQVFVQDVTGDSYVLAGQGVEADGYPHNAFNNWFVWCVSAGATGNALSIDPATDTYVFGCVLGALGYGGFLGANSSASQWIGCHYDHTNQAALHFDNMNDHRVVGGRVHGCCGGIEAVGSGAGTINVNGTEFRAPKTDSRTPAAADNAFDAVYIAPTAAVRGIMLDALDFANTAGSSMRWRNLINIANSNARDTVIGPYSMSPNSPATQVYGSQPVANGGYRTRNHNRLFPNLFESDDFLSGVAGTDGQIGKLGWRRTSVNGSITAVDPGSPHLGAARLATGTPNASLTALYLRGNTLGLFDADGDAWEMLQVFKLGQVDAHTILRIGAALNADGDPPANGCWVEKLAGDSNLFAANTAASTQSARSDLGAADSGWHELHIRRFIDAGTPKIGYTLDTGTEALISTNIPTGTIQPFYEVKNGTDGASKTGDIDYWEFLVQDLAR